MFYMYFRICSKMNIWWNKPDFFHNFHASLQSFTLDDFSVAIQQKLDWNFHKATSRNAELRQNWNGPLIFQRL